MICSYYPDPKITIEEENKKRSIELLVSYCLYNEFQEVKGDYYRIIIFTVKEEDEKETRRIVILNNKPRSLFEETEIVVITIDKEGTEIWRETIYDDIVNTAKIEKEVVEEVDEVISFRTTFKLVF